jgi:hypothetical protein
MGNHLWILGRRCGRFLVIGFSWRLRRLYSYGFLRGRIFTIRRSIRLGRLGRFLSALTFIWVILGCFLREVGGGLSSGFRLRLGWCNREMKQVSFRRRWDLHYCIRKVLMWLAFAWVLVACFRFVIGWRVRGFWRLGRWFFGDEIILNVNRNLFYELLAIMSLRLWLLFVIDWYFWKVIQSQIIIWYKINGM